jgi:hypothetical protein
MSCVRFEWGPASVPIYRHAVIVPLDIDVIIDADPADAAFGINVRLQRQWFERRPVQLFE